MKHLLIILAVLFCTTRLAAQKQDSTPKVHDTVRIVYRNFSDTVKVYFIYMGEKNNIKYCKGFTVTTGFVNTQNSKDGKVDSQIFYDEKYNMMKWNVIDIKPRLK